MPRDDFAVADVANIGPNFTLATGTNQRIVSQAAQGNSSSTTYAIYRWNGAKMPSDNFRVDIGIKTPANGTASATTTHSILLRMPDSYATSGAAGTEIMVSYSKNGAWGIYSCVQVSATSRATGTLGAGFNTGDILTVTAIGTRYELYCNGVLVPGAVWTDTSNSVISIGTTKRNFGLLIQCVATNQQAPAVDWIVATDVSSQFFCAA